MHRSSIAVLTIVCVVGILSLQLPVQEIDFEALPSLPLGVFVSGVITTYDPVAAIGLAREKEMPGYTVRRKSFQAEVLTTGQYTFELRSHYFDCYLAVRDELGVLLGEDDDGLLRTHAQLSITLESARKYRVDVCAVESDPGDPGEFEVLFREGVGKELGPKERAAAELADARDSLRILEQELEALPSAIARCVESLARLLQAQGEYGEARPLFERALRIRLAVFGDDHLRTAESQNSFGLFLWGMGELAEAKRLLQQSLQTHTEALGEDHIHTTAVLNNLALVVDGQGDPEEAAQLFERVLEVTESVLGPDDPGTAQALSNLAASYFDLGRYEMARPLLEEVVEVYELSYGELHPQTAQSLYNLAALNLTLGHLSQSKLLSERAFRIREALFGENHPDLASSLHGLASLNWRLGDLSVASGLAERALRIRREALGENHPNTLQSMRILGLIRSSQGDAVGARLLYEQVLTASEAFLGARHPSLTTDLYHLSLLLDRQGDLEGSKELAQRALEIAEERLGKDHPVTARSLNHLGLLLSSEGDHESARRMVERALKVRRQVFGREHYRTAESVHNLATVLMRMGQASAARELFEEALEINEAVYGPEHRSTADSLHNLSWLLHSLRDLREAKELSERALEIRRKQLGEDHPRTTRSLNILALLCLDLGEPEQAYEMSSMALDVEMARQSRLLWSLTEAERLLLARQQRWALRTLLSVSLADNEKQGASAAFRAVLSWKGQIFRSLSTSRGAQLSVLDASSKARVETLRELQAALSRELLRRDIMDREPHENRLADLRHRRSKLESDLVRSMAQDGERGVPSVVEISARMPPGSVAVSFFLHHLYEPAERDEASRVVRTGRWGPRRLSAWVLRAGEDEVQHVDLGEAALLEQETTQFLDEMVQARGVSAVSGRKEQGSPREDLTSLLWGPLSSFIGEAELVFLSPDGFLRTLPFETLQLPDGVFLVERHSFVYLESIGAIVDCSRPEVGNATSRLLCVGDVDYRSRAEVKMEQKAPARTESLLTHPDGRGSFLNRWVSLPATAEESRAIRELHEDCFANGTRQELSGREATEERVKEELPQYQVVHLATHGFFQPEGLPSMWRQVRGRSGEMQLEMFEEEERIVGLMPGLLSGLVFAGANRVPEDHRDDGLLTAEEISFLDLSEVSLVVLSACETALGKVESGEGMLGLRRTFRQAGARTVISSLWSVKDQSTSQLMQRFYERLWLSGESVLQALRGAQLDLLKQNRIESEGRGLPSTWGAFVLDGCWR
jgi:CHAT domain-containing protein/tetratricopeptide (TPR) repeat protein